MPERPAELRLARLHLRTGSYALARVELETAAGSGTLDAEAMLDLAEIRWRTDDLTGAGEAAAAYLAAGRESLIALAIAAEATAALGRPGEAGRLARRAVEIAEIPLDTLFAGIRRSDVWPAEVAVASADVGTQLVPPVGISPSTDAEADPEVSADGAGGGPAAAGVPTAVAAVADERSVGGPPAPAPRAADELAAARASLAAGDRADAAVRLSVVLRVSPSLAPAVLDIAAGEPGPEFDLVRGDALRLVGHESQARRSYAAAVSRLGADASGTGDGSPPDVAPADPEVADAEIRSEAEAHAEALAEIAATSAAEASPAAEGDEPPDRG